MSGLAHIALANGHNVYGSDLQESTSTKRLVDQGAIIYNKHDKNNISNDIDLVVYTSAIKKDNVEYIEALSKNIEVKNRAVFLGEMMGNYQTPISISGTHGKTTTTSMVSTIFKYGQYDPTILVGGNLDIINGNVCIGKSEYFITEACEYTNSFLHFNSKIAVVLNIEEDHLDYFSGLDEIKESFNKFGKLVDKDGFFIINGDNKNCDDIDEGVVATTIRFGKNKNNNAIFEILHYDDRGCATFTVSYNDYSLGTFTLSVPGEHNVYNAVSAILVAYVSGINIDEIRKNISLYNGVGRRFEHKGLTVKNAIVIDDYAHHPTEIKATLDAVRNIAKGKIWAIFQPHTYSRTLTLLDEFGEAFYDADHVIIPDIYASREKFTKEISSIDLCDKISYNFEHTILCQDKTVTYIPTFKQIVDHVRDNAQENDIILTIGAGNIYEVSELLVVK